MNINRFIYLFLLFTGLSGQAFQGYTIFSPAAGGAGGGTTGMTYLINNSINVINSWYYPRGPASLAYLQRDSTLIYPFRVQNPTMAAGGVGGGIVHMDWDSNV